MLTEFTQQQHLLLLHLYIFFFLNVLEINVSKLFLKGVHPKWFVCLSESLVFHTLFYGLVHHYTSNRWCWSQSICLISVDNEEVALCGELTFVSISKDLCCCCFGKHIGRQQTGAIAFHDEFSFRLDVLLCNRICVPRNTLAVKNQASR